jgi:hypothetical protein
MRRFFIRLLDSITLRNDGDNSIKPSLRKIAFWTLVITIVLFLSLLFFFSDSKSYAILTAAAILGAYYAGGCAIGFIFAVPKSLQRNTVLISDGTDAGQKQSNFSDNASLEEISDWLTKIIIGLSLTQFNHLQAMLRDASLNISASLQDVALTSSGAQRLLPFSYGFIILYSAAGMIYGYLWTRVEFPKILKQRDDDLTKQKEVNRSLLRKLNNPGDNEVALAGLMQTQKSVDSTQIELMHAILRSKPLGPDPDDPQKGRWGRKSIADNRQLTADVVVSSIPSLYKVTIKVSTLDNTPLTGPVGIVLHDTFEPMLRVLDPHGQSEVFVDVVAYEAFAVGAMTDVQSEKEYKQMELDLNDLPNLPEGFYWK